MSELQNLTTEKTNPASENLDEMTAAELVDLINSEDRTVADAVAAQSVNITRAVEVVADRLGSGGRLIYIGAGTSGRLGVLDAAECPPTFSSDPNVVVGLIAGGDAALKVAVEGAEDHPELGAADLKQLDLTDGDVVVGIASSGRTPYVIGGLQYAQQVGAYAIGFTCNEGSHLVDVSDLVICTVVGPEVLTGSTRMKAGTATKLVLNTITTAAMVLLGKSYGNLMVDLSATNSKLKDRSARIVCRLTGVNRLEAEQVLAACDGDLKTAIVSQQLGVEPQEARRRLEAGNGHLRQALNHRD